MWEGCVKGDRKNLWDWRDPLLTPSFWLTIYSTLQTGKKRWAPPHPLPFFEFSFFRKDKVHVTFQHKILELRWLYTRGKTILFFWKFVCFMAEMRWVYMIPQVLVLVLEPLSCRLSGVLQRNASYQCKRARNRRKSSLDRPLKRFGNTTEPPKPHFWKKRFWRL